MLKNSNYGLSLFDRLSQSGIREPFSQAVKSGNTLEMISLLKQIDYSNDAATATAETFRNNPDAFKP